MLDILYLDSRLVAVNKPSGLLVHPSAMARDPDTCLSLLRHQLDRWVYPLHRLDRGTSGVLLFALDSDTAALLGQAFASHQLYKKYLAVVRGFAPESGTIDYPLNDDDLPGSPAVPAVTSFERRAITELPIPVGRYPTARYSLVQATPSTGRRHQIRRHLAHIRHPIVGDIVHGEGRHNRLFREQFGLHRLLLHASRISIPYSDDTGNILTVEAPLPDELAHLFEELRWEMPGATGDCQYAP